MKRRDLTLLNFKKVSYTAWTKLALIWTQLQSSWMPLAPSSTTADMQRHSLTSWWPAECWVRRGVWVQTGLPAFNSTPTSWSESQWCRYVFFLLCAAPGGTLSDDMTRTDYCLFTAQEDLETMQAYAQVYSTCSPEGLVVLRENGAKHLIYFKHFVLSCWQTDPQASL